MRKEDCFYLGKIIKKYSFNGQVVIKLDTDEPELYKSISSVFIDLGNNLVPFSIKKSLLSNSKMLRVEFEGISCEKDADSILKSDIYLPLNLLPKLFGNKFYYHEVIGFNVVDVHFGFVGILNEINEYSPQPLFKIKQDEKQILIPIVDHFIKKIDRSNKTIIIQTPEGLIDLYRNN